MEKTTKIFIRNNQKSVEIPIGSTLEEAYLQSGLTLTHGPISARVNNKVEGMHYRIYKQKEVEFLDITSPSGMRAYTRSLFFILCNLLEDLCIVFRMAATWFLSMIILKFKCFCTLFPIS